MTDPLIIYTDGACTDGHGGWAIVLQKAGGNQFEYRSGNAKNTTNNRMELTAVIEAFTQAAGQPCHIQCDSQYVVNGLTSWIHTWKKRNWRTSDGKQVQNVDLWQTLDGLRFKSGKDVKLSWCRGHSCDGIEEADRIAKQEKEWSLAYAKPEVTELLALKLWRNAMLAAGIDNCEAYEFGLENFSEYCKEEGIDEDEAWGEL